MAITENTYTGNGSTVLYSFTFPYLATTDIKVSLNGVNTTAYTLANPTTIQFNSAPANGAAIRIYRQTDDAGTKATFFPGSAIRSQDLNDNFLQVLYKSQETETFAAATDASSIQATATAALNNSNTALTNSSSALTTANGIAATANTALSNSTAAVNTANASLPKTGGTMTGNITFNGTQTFPNSGLQQATTGQQGIVQLTDSTSSTSTTTAATPSAVKSAFDLATSAQTTANAALPLTGGTLTGNLSIPSLNGGPLAGTRNRIINGDMRIAQRGTSFAALDPAAGTYTLDRWQFSGGTTTGRATISQSSSVPNNTFSSSLYCDVTTADAAVAAGDVAFIQQTVEGFNTRDLIGTTFTISFWVYATKTGTYCIALRNSAPDRSYVAEYTVNISNTWEYKTITITGGLITAGTWDWTNGVGFRLAFALICGSTFQTTANAWQTGNFIGTANQINALDSTTNDFYITGVQLEPGTVATPFERRSYGQELALCQRYFQLAGNGCFGAVDGNSSSVIAFSEKFFVPMRVAPTVTWRTGATANWRYNGGDINNSGSTSLANTISTANAVWSQQTGFAALTVIAPIWSRNQTSTGEFMACNAEL